MRLLRQPTCTSIVEAALRAPGVEFMNMDQLRSATKCNLNQISAVLHTMRRYRVVDVVVNADGTGWWFALPSEMDTRTRHAEGIVQGIKRNRKPRKLQGEGR